MMTAEKWYAYQDNYKRYGFDMKPKTVKKAPKARTEAITVKDKVKMVLLLLLGGALCVCIIISAAYTARIKYEMNSIMNANAELRGEIENLNVEIKNATNIRTIEEKALNELGMVYPSAEKFVFIIEEPEIPQCDFAMLLKEQAYN